MRDILDTVGQWVDEDRPVALATVVETWGSAPRGVGSKMAVTPDLSMIGSVSGGCVENAVIEEALAGLEDHRPRLLKFGVADDTAWEVGLTCGGRISVYTEPLDRQWWRITSESTRTDTPVTTVTILEGDRAGQKIVVDETGAVRYQTSDLPGEVVEALQQAAREHRTSTWTTAAGYEVMVDVMQARPHLIMIGGVHVAMPLSVYANQLGFRVSIVDPRAAFATEARFPDVTTILHSYPDKALPQLGLTNDTYLAVLTHDPKIDDPALIAALTADVPYVGVLSSSRTHEKRVARLKAAGLTDEQLARIRTPIGIDIGANTPEEIALCIMAEIVGVRNGVLA